MKRPFRPFGSRSTRLLAGLLVAAALLLNGVAAAMAATVSMAPDCCAGMEGQHGDQAPCHESGNPCPPAGDDCNDQCLARCLGSTALPSMAAPLLASFPRESTQLLLIAPPFSSAPRSPGLRPPISA